jgi:hypothetical protein
MGIGVGMPFPYYIREPNYTLVAMGRKRFNCVWCLYLGRYLRSYQTGGMLIPTIMFAIFAMHPMIYLLKSHALQQAQHIYGASL